jgi:hypothetical protein
MAILIAGSFACLTYSIFKISKNNKTVVEEGKKRLVAFLESENQTKYYPRGVQFLVKYDGIQNHEHAMHKIVYLLVLCSNRPVIMPQQIYANNVHAALPIYPQQQNYPPYVQYQPMQVAPIIYRQAQDQIDNKDGLL